MKNKSSKPLVLAIAVVEGIFIAIAIVKRIGSENIYLPGIFIPIKWISGFLACILCAALVGLEEGKYKGNALLMFVANAMILITG